MRGPSCADGWQGATSCYGTAHGKYGLPSSIAAIPARDETRALCGLCHNKECLVLLSLLLTAADAAYVYYVIVRISGSRYLPFPMDQSELHDASINPVMSWFELATFILDMVSVFLLGLAGALSTFSPQGWPNPLS